MEIVVDGKFVRIDEPLEAKSKGLTYKYSLIDESVVLLDILNCGSIFDIPDEIDGKPVTAFYPIDEAPRSNITSVIVGNNLKTFYVHTVQFSKIDSVTFKNGYKNGPECVRNIVSMIVEKNMKSRMTLPLLKLENYTEGVFQNDLLLSKDKKKLVLAYTRESFSVPSGVEVIGTRSILKTFKKTSVVTYPKTVTTFEDYPFVCKSDEFYAFNSIPSSVTNIGAGIICSSVNGKFATENDKDKSPIVKYSKNGKTILYLNGNIKTVTQTGLQEISRMTYDNTVISKENGAFSILNDLIIYNKDTFVGSVNVPMANLIVVPKEITKTVFKPHFGYRKFKSIVYECENDKQEIKDTKPKKAEEKSKASFICVDALNNIHALSSFDGDVLKLTPKDFPYKGRSKTPHYGFILNSACNNLRELIIPEGFDYFEIGNIDPKECKLEVLGLPSTISVTNLLPKLNRFKNLILVMIAPSKKVQVKFKYTHYIVANCKKKKKNSLFYTYSYADCNSEFDSPYCAGTDAGITYISGFKRDKFVKLNGGYYYLIEVDGEKAYRLLKTDFVEEFDYPDEINGIPVKYFDPNWDSNAQHVKRKPEDEYMNKYGSCFNDQSKWTNEMFAMRIEIGKKFIDE